MKPKAMTFEEYYDDEPCSGSIILKEAMQAVFDGVLAAEKVAESNPPKARVMLFEACDPVIFSTVKFMELAFGSDALDRFAILVADPYDRGGKEVLKRMGDASDNVLRQMRRWYLNRPVCLALGKDNLAEAMRPPISFNARQKLEMAPGEVMNVVIAYGGIAYFLTPYPDSSGFTHTIL